MKNPIEDGRLVCDYTFATRLLRLAENLEVADACSESEKDAFLSYAKRLLKYQCRTVTDQCEKDYLMRVGVYDEFSKPDLITFDQIEIYYDNCKDLTLYSCMKNPGVGELMMRITNIDEDRMKSRNPDRLFFSDWAKCSRYIEEHSKTISIAVLRALGLYDQYMTQTQ